MENIHDVAAAPKKVDMDWGFWRFGSEENQMESSKGGQWAFAGTCS